jgi:hypothetical protein
MNALNLHILKPLSPIKKFRCDFHAQKSGEPIVGEVVLTIFGEVMCFTFRKQSLCKKG